MTTRTITLGVAFLLGALLIAPAANAQSCSELAEIGLETGICAQASEKAAYAFFLCEAAVEGAADLDRCGKACSTAEKKCNSQMNQIKNCDNAAVNGTTTVLKKGKTFSNKDINACGKEHKATGSDVKDDQAAFCAPQFSGNCGCSIACSGTSETRGCELGDELVCEVDNASTGGS